MNLTKEGLRTAVNVLLKIWSSGGLRHVEYTSKMKALLDSQKQKQERPVLSDKEFAEIYNSFCGSDIDKTEQINSHDFTGEGLKLYTEHIIRTVTR